MFRRFIVSMVIVLFCSVTVRAENNVQIDLESLKSYQPPPMFGTSSAQPEQSRSPVTIYRPELDESQVIQPTVQDILQQLDGVPMGAAPAVQKIEITPPQETVIDKPSRVYARPAIKKGNIHTTAQEVKVAPPSPVFEPLNYVLQVQPGTEGLSPEQQAGIRAAVLPALQAEGVRLFITAYATGTDGTESEARRSSLRRALEAKTFLMGLNVPEDRIHVFPLGDHAPIPPENRLIFVTQM
jgi:hypothetical protein